MPINYNRDDKQKTSRDYFKDTLKKNQKTGLYVPKQKEALNWMRSHAQLVQTTPERMLSSAQGKGDLYLLNQLSNANIGELFMWNYQAKWDKELPYWDAWPMDFIVAVESNYFYAINMHYLPPMLRSQFMDSLYGIVTNDKWDRTTKLKLSYQLLKATSKFKYFKPCFKKYLFSYVRSRFLGIHPISWEIGIFLPTARFQKASNEDVWRDSMNAIQKTSFNLSH